MPLSPKEISLQFLTKAGGVIEREIVHDPGTKEAPPEEEILSSLLHRSTALLARLMKTQRQENKDKAADLQVSFCVWKPGCLSELLLP